MVFLSFINLKQLKDVTFMSKTPTTVEAYFGLDGGAVVKVD